MSYSLRIALASVAFGIFSPMIWFFLGVNGLRLVVNLFCNLDLDFLGQGLYSWTFTCDLWLIEAWGSSQKNERCGLFFHSNCCYGFEAPSNSHYSMRETET